MEKLFGKIKKLYSIILIHQLARKCGEHSVIKCMHSATDIFIAIKCFYCISR